MAMANIERIARVVDSAISAGMYDPKLRDEIIAHNVLVFDLLAEYEATNIVFDGDRYFRQGEIAIRAAIEAKLQRNKHRAGYNALRNKYGEDGAKRIISRKNS